MEERILLRRILEGLIHNLNNPLNLILGYAQRLQANHPELSEADKILSAGFQMDDQLQALTAKLMDDTLLKPQAVNMSQWLQQEIKYLYNYLPIKHKLILKPELQDHDVTVNISPLLCSAWLESKLLALINSDYQGSNELSLGIAKDQNSPALVLKFSEPVSEEIQILLCEDHQNDESLGQMQRLKSVWNSETNSLLGVIS